MTSYVSMTSYPLTRPGLVSLHYGTLS